MSDQEWAEAAVRWWWDHCVRTLAKTVEGYACEPKNSPEAAP